MIELINATMIKYVQQMKKYTRRGDPRISAIQMTEEFTLKEVTGTQIGKAGDWLCMGFFGNVYIIPNELFQKMFVKSE